MFSPLTPPADLPLWLSILLAVLLIGAGRGFAAPNNLTITPPARQGIE